MLKIDYYKMIKNAAEQLFDPTGGEYEIGGKIKADGLRHAALRIYHKGNYKDGTEHYEVTLDRKLLNELAEGE